MPISPDHASLARFLSGCRRRLVAARLLKVWLITGTLLLVFTALLQFLFALFPWTALPLLFNLLVALTALFLFGHVMITFILRFPSLCSVARLMERRNGNANNPLSVALELAGDPGTADNPFTHAATRRAVDSLASLAKPASAPAYGGRLTTAMMLLGAWCWLNPVFSPRLLDYWSLPFAGKGDQTVIVEPGSVSLPRHAGVTLSLFGTSYPSARLLIKTAGGSQTTVLLRPDTAGRFTHRLDSIDRSFSYSFKWGGTGTSPETVTMVPPPRLARLRVTVFPPPYTRLPARDLGEGQGSFEAYAGSRARITIESPRLAAARIVLERDSVEMTLDNDRAVGDITIRRSGHYTFALRDTLGQTNDSLPLFRIGSIADESPSAAIIRPGFSKPLETAQIETLTVEGVDDIGIRELSLQWRKNKSPGEVGSRSITTNPSGRLFRSSFVWRLAELSLYPGDTVFYWAYITDTRMQVACSDTFWFRIPSFAEIHQRIARQQESTDRSLRAVKGRQRDAMERLEALAKGKENELTWEQKDALRAVKNSMAAQGDSLRESLARLEQTIAAMNREGAIGEEMAQKLEEVRRAVEEIVREYGEELLPAIKDTPVTPRDMRQAVDRLRRLLPKLDRQLDSVLKFLELLRQERKLGELAMRLERLAKEQETLARKGEKNGQRQDELLEEYRKTADEVTSKLKKEPAGKRAADSLASLMRKTAAQGEVVQPSTKRRMSAAMLSLSEELFGMMQFDMQARQDKDRQRLMRVADDALTLSRWQEELRTRTGGEMMRADIAREQQALRDALRKSRNAADSLSTLPPQMMIGLGQGFRTSMAASDRVIGDLQYNNGSVAMARNAAALRALSGEALSAMSGLDKGMQGQCSGSACMMPGLRQMSGRQAAVNALTGELLRQLFGQGQSPGGDASGRDASGRDASRQSAARQAAAAAQKGVADQLERLNRQLGDEAGGAMAVRVEELEKEARRIAEMLEHPEPDILERQDRLLSRMLETTLSLNRREDGKDSRKAESARTPFLEGVLLPLKEFSRDADAFYRLRQKAFSGEFPESYRARVREYFDALGERWLGGDEN